VKVESANAEGPGLDESDFSRLAAAFQRGDRAAFKVLVDSLSRSLIAMAYRYTRDWEWARDLTQETWVRVHERIERYDARRSFRGWLYAVHRNACLSFLRRGWVRKEHLLGDAELGADLAWQAPDAQEEIERREFRRSLLAALTQLSERQRQVLVRVDLEGGDQREVAETMGMNFTTLRTTLHFARRRVAALLRTTEESL
jgi:RNA polymerase sigma-70 factor (ECF subfamily)